MIEKFDDQNGFCMADCMNKINEVINAVNNQQIQLNNHECRLLDLQNQINKHDQEIDDCAATISKMENVEPAENVPDLDIQMSWIGHLCRFWDYNEIESTYAILDDINVWCEHPYRKSNGNQYKHCEPVKPDDDIIYKGGDNV